MGITEGPDPQADHPADAGAASFHGAYVITNAEESYEEQHRRRVHRYLLIMAFRIPALIASAWIYSATGNWPIALAVIAVSIPIPWIAVIRANDRPRRRRGETGRFTARKLDRLALQGHPIKTIPGVGECSAMLLSPGLAEVCRRLGPALSAAGFTESAVRALLGDEVFACLSRGEPGPVEARAAASAEPLAVLTTLFLAAAPVPRSAAAAALAPVTVDEAVAVGLLEPDPDDASAVRAALGLRPLDLPDGGTQWFVSDLDGLMRPHPQHREHVLGVGHASQSLLRATPREPGGAPPATVLDLGTGCGVHACAAARFAGHVTATDVSARAAGFATASAALNDVPVEVLLGDWFAPVAGRRFDLLLANPPFVVGEGRIEHTYRDSGLDLDGASELVVRGAPSHLAPGGTAALLASWVHRDGESWQGRVASWLPSEGVAAWVLQRDVADPALYVGTWLRDEGLDPRVGEGRAKSDRWLAHLADAGVTGIGFGFVFLRSVDGPSEVVCEELAQPFDDPLGAEVPAHFARMAWLRSADLGSARPLLCGDVALERVSVAGGPGSETGWDEVTVRVTRMSGPRWTHEIDDTAARLLAGCRGGLSTDDLVDLLEAATGEDDLRDPAHRLLADLYRHGFVTFL